MVSAFATRPTTMRVETLKKAPIARSGASRGWAEQGHKSRLPATVQKRKALRNGFDKFLVASFQGLEVFDLLK